MKKFLTLVMLLGSLGAANAQTEPATPVKDATEKTEQAADAVKESAVEATESVKEGAVEATEAVKGEGKEATKGEAKLLLAVRESQKAQSATMLKQKQVMDMDTQKQDMTTVQ